MENRGYSLVVRGLLIAGASLVAERCRAPRLQQLRPKGSEVAVPGLYSTGSVIAAHGLNCSWACGIFPDQGSNPRLLQWQADSLLLGHQGSPSDLSLTNFGIKNSLNIQTSFPQCCLESQGVGTREVQAGTYGKIQMYIRVI